MSYGCQIWDASGTLKLDVSDRLTQFIWSTLAASGTTSSQYLSAINGRDTVIVARPVINSSITDSFMWQYIHEVYRSGDTIYWSPIVTDSSGRSHAMRISIFAYT
jgi:hypothetical protein